MDTRTPAIDVAAAINDIRSNMPETYQAIKAKADQIGSEAYALVRRGIKGEPNCFYAMEGGRVVGHPFNLPGLPGNIASLVLQFGCRHMVWWRLPKEVADGAH
ncbi:hypothetical protein [Xylophilus sp. Leaf220]|uniref:hypothetical protein n=1 Tax=Xylophilus sp. Leaf220 TaxID=1735686 RepID=UPI0012E32592|nr:hypothetical protein [Xylophilus sp. Leaf220]